MAIPGKFIVDTTETQPEAYISVAGGTASLEYTEKGVYAFQRELGIKAKGADVAEAVTNLEAIFDEIFKFD